MKLQSVFFYIRNSFENRRSHDQVENEGGCGTKSRNDAPMTGHDIIMGSSALILIVAFTYALFFAPHEVQKPTPSPTLTQQASETPR